MEKSTGEILNKAFENGKRHEMESGGCPQCTIVGLCFGTVSLLY